LDLQPMHALGSRRRREDGARVALLRGGEIALCRVGVVAAPRGGVRVRGGGGDVERGPALRCGVLLRLGRSGCDLLAELLDVGHQSMSSPERATRNGVWSIWTASAP